MSVVPSAPAGQPVAAPGQDDLGDRLLAYCLGRLHDPGLTPASVAHAHHVSLRYLHKVLGARGLMPAGERRGRGSHGGVHVLLRRLAQLGEHLAGRGG
ncbi:hypothetical protein ACU635_36575 [[Actinomadura] parvosata]|uniref:hypothetical protein n=1 Tax=[Actinomadura] parvosata TaxID=1955412 RepID=UPI00406D428B